MTDWDALSPSSFGLRAALLTGDEYLSQASALLQRIRLRSPLRGPWEAADLQWWWRQQRPTDAAGQLFWLDERDEAAAAAIRTQFRDSIQCDVHILADDPGFRRAVWREAVSLALALDPDRTEFPVTAADEEDAAGLLEAAGFRPSAEAIVACWLDAARRPAIPPLPPGYHLYSRASPA